MCLWKRERTYLFLPFGTTLVRQPHYAGGRCADKLEEYTAVLGNRASLDSIAGTYNGARSGGAGGKEKQNRINLSNT